MNGRESFPVPGYCYACQRPSVFSVDFQDAYEVDGVLTPNWRERLICSHCGLNNRIRAAVQIFDVECKPQATDSIYITEQTTPLFAWLRNRYQNLVASEYLRDWVEPGTSNAQGVRNEDLTNLTFSGRSFNYVLSFDVLEHIPDYRAAFSEIFRCLCPGGALLFSVPFRLDSPHNIVRARVDGNGDTTLLMPPEYHGDPISGQGCLCYYHFGWQLLDELRDIGFAKVYAMAYWSRDLGYLGRQQCLFYARKALQ